MTTGPSPTAIAYPLNSVRMRTRVNTSMVSWLSVSLCYAVVLRSRTRRVRLSAFRFSYGVLVAQSRAVTLISIGVSVTR